MAVIFDHDGSYPFAYDDLYILDPFGIGDVHRTRIDREDDMTPMGPISITHHDGDVRPRWGRSRLRTMIYILDPLGIGEVHRTGIDREDDMTPMGSNIHNTSRR